MEMNMPLSQEEMKKRHIELDEYMDEFREHAHMLMDKINQVPELQGGYILNETAVKALPVSVIILMSKFCQFKPTYRQRRWRAELRLITELIKIQ